MGKHSLTCRLWVLCHPQVRYVACGSSMRFSLILMMLGVAAHRSEICMRARASLVPLLMEQPAETASRQKSQSLDGSGTGSTSLGDVPPSEGGQQEAERHKVGEGQEAQSPMSEVSLRQPQAHVTNMR